MLLAAAQLTPALAAPGELSGQLPNLGEAGSGILSPAEEQELGRKFMQSVQQRFALVDDPLANAYLQDLTDRLLSQLNQHEQSISVFIVDDPAINAFAGPGGHIGVHSGLILTARSEAELASVLAHEIAHVEQRHLVRRFEAGSRLTLQTMGAVIAAILLGDNPQASQAILSSAMAGSAQQQLAYSREHEQEADRIGLELLASADFDPRAMVSFFQVLHQQTRIGESGAPEFIRTHPLTTARIADTDARAQRYPAARKGENPLFQIIQARLAAAASQNSAALAAFQQRLRSQQVTRETAQYARALAALKAANHGEARSLLRPLLADDPLRLQYHFTAAEIELADRRPQQARDILEGILSLNPGNPYLTELLARTLLQLDQPAQAQQLMKDQIRRAGMQPRLYQLYAQAAIEAGRPAEAYRSLAEVEYFFGNLHQAIDYLEQALTDTTVTEMERLALDSRLKAMKAEAPPAK
jgi:predicted Zn-dependent protease